MAFYEMVSWKGTLEVKKFKDDKEARIYAESLPEYANVSFRRITQEEADEIERKTAEGLTKILLGFNKSMNYS